MAGGELRPDQHVQAAAVPSLFEMNDMNARKREYDQRKRILVDPALAREADG